MVNSARCATGALPLMDPLEPSFVMADSLLYLAEKSPSNWPGLLRATCRPAAFCGAGAKLPTTRSGSSAVQLRIEIVLQNKVFTLDHPCRLGRT